MTRKQCEALARKLYGPTAGCEENTRALGPIGREELAAKIRAATTRRKEIEPQLKPLPWKALTDAARFSLDVDGDEPSWSQLRAATERAEQFQYLSDEYVELGRFVRDHQGSLTRRRCCVTLNKGWCYEVVAWCDTWAECAEEMEAAAKQSTAV